MAILMEESYGPFGLCTRWICIDTDGISLMRKDRLQKDGPHPNPPKRALATHKNYMATIFDVQRWIEGGYE